jgi:hypothetical protein
MGLQSSTGQTIPAQQANQIVSTYRRQMTDRSIPPVPRYVERSQATKIHIFNVGPWEHKKHLGGYGEYTIPACPEGQDYVAGPVFTDPMTELYMKNEAEMGRFEEDGWQFANEFLGDGRGQNSAYSLRHMGCFVAAGEKPTKEELALAMQELDEKCRQLVDEARQFHASNDPVLRRAITPEWHFRAAERLKLTDEDWMVARNPKGRQKCKLCGTLVDGDVLKCPTSNCGYIFDMAAYTKVMEEQQKAIAKAGGKEK